MSRGCGERPEGRGDCGCVSGEGTQAGVGWAGLVGSEDEAESTLARGLAFIIVPVSTVLPEEAAEFPETLCSISNFPDT